MLGIRIMLLRKRMGLSQTQLAKMLNISASAEGMYEQGRRAPSIDILIALSQIFSVSLDYLITGTEYRNDKINVLAENRAEIVQECCPCKLRCRCCARNRCG